MVQCAVRLFTHHVLTPLPPHPSALPCPALPCPALPCPRRLKAVLQSDERVHRLIDAIEALGCKVPESFISCRPCPAHVSGGFVVDTNATKAARLATPYEPKIVMCENDVDKVRRHCHACLCVCICERGGTRVGDIPQACASYLR